MKTGTIEPDQTGQAWADWHAGPSCEAGVAASSSTSAAARQLLLFARPFDSACELCID